MRRPPRIPPEADFTPEALAQRQAFACRVTGADLSPLHSEEDLSVYRGNVENLFGFVRVPVGLAGPLRLQGRHAQGEFLVPLATTEGTLVASYNRGMKAISQAGGARVAVTRNEIDACALFLTASPEAARALAAWIDEHVATVRAKAEATTRHGRLLRVASTPLGSRLAVSFFYDPGDAMGINMITSASYAAARWIAQQQEGVGFLLPAAFQGDKKPTHHNFLRGRGRSVRAEITLPARVLRETLKSEARAIERVYRANLEVAPLAGSLGFNMHIANGITALGLATGQDVAYVAESASGHLLVERREEDLIVTLQIPSLYVGTVGGGTGLPGPRACLELLGCAGAGSALKLAEIFAGTCLAGELSVLAAVATGQFVQAHETLGRNRPQAD